MNETGLIARSSRSNPYSAVMEISPDSYWQGRWCEPLVDREIDVIIRVSYVAYSVVVHFERVDGQPWFAASSPLTLFRRTFTPCPAPAPDRRCYQAYRPGRWLEQAGLRSRATAAQS